MNKVSSKTGTAILSVLMLGCVTVGPINADEKPDSAAASEGDASSHMQANANEKSEAPAVSGPDAVGHMHSKLEEDQAPYKAKEARALRELNEMTIREDVRIADVNAKIDELMAAKTQIMRLRYDHLIEMRRILTDEQKVSYDRNVLKRSAVH